MTVTKRLMPDSSDGVRQVLLGLAAVVGAVVVLGVMAWIAEAWPWRASSTAGLGADALAGLPRSCQAE